jgi:hypothetical protein
MAFAALTGWSVFITFRLFLHMTAPAQLMKLRFHQCCDCRICFVTGETQTLATVVDVIVMTPDAAHALMGFVGKCHGQHGGLRTCLLLITLEQKDREAQRGGSQQQHDGFHGLRITV